jgi:hypothetical protein
MGSGFARSRFPEGKAMTDGLICNRAFTNRLRSD